MSLEAGIKRPLPGMPERRMPEVVSQRQSLGQILVEAKLARQRAGDLRHLQRMSQARSVMIALMEDEDLGFVLETTKSGGMDDAVAIPAEGAAGLARRLLEQPPPAEVGVAGLGRARSSPSD